jgi:cytochrome c-type biogenesis protein CcmH/NrfF
MMFGAVVVYVSSVPQSPWILYIYLPIGMILLSMGVVVLFRAQLRYEAQVKETSRVESPPRVS